MKDRKRLFVSIICVLLVVSLVITMIVPFFV